MRLGKQDATAGKCVEMRRDGLPMTRTPHHSRMVLVGENQENIGTGHGSDGSSHECDFLFWFREKHFSSINPVLTISGLVLQLAIAGLVLQLAISGLIPQFQKSQPRLCIRSKFHRRRGLSGAP